MGKRRIKDGEMSKAIDVAKHSAKKVKVADAGNAVLRSARLGHETNVDAHTAKQAESVSATNVVRRSARQGNATDVENHTANAAETANAGNIGERDFAFRSADYLTRPLNIGERAVNKSEIAGVVSAIRCSTGPADSVIGADKGAPEQSIEIENMERKMMQRKSSARTSVVQERESKAGRPGTFMNVPFDIFYKIAKYLEPLGLLNLSRTSKDLRSILTTKRTEDIWRAAREALEMPNCPPDLSEMQYADLVFGDNCYSCNAPRIRNVYYEHRMRLCVRCREAKLVHLSLFSDLFGTIFTKFARTWNVRVERIIPDGIYALVLEDEGYYCIDEVQNVWNKLQAITTRYAELRKFTVERRQKVSEIKNHASELRKWITKQRSLRG